MAINYEALLPLRIHPGLMRPLGIYNNGNLLNATKYPSHKLLIQKTVIYLLTKISLSQHSSNYKPL